MQGFNETTNEYERRTTRLWIRVTPAEKRALKSAAAANGMGVSAWVRFMLRRQATPERTNGYGR